MDFYIRKVLKQSRHACEMLNEHVFLKSVLYIFNKYFFMVTIYVEGVYVVVKN